MAPGQAQSFDSLVQTASGFNHAEAQAAGQPTPKPLPMQILDHASGYLMAFAAQAALARQATEGGSWHVRVSLAQTAHWLRPGSHRGRAGHAHAGHRCLPANGSVGLRRTGRLAPRRAVLADAGALDPAVLSAGHASHGLALGLA